MISPMERKSVSRLALRRGLLAFGVGLGVTLVGYGLIRGERPGMSVRGPETIGDTLAMVNGVPIGAERFERMVATLELDRRGQKFDAVQRRWLLDQLIADELLLQRAIELGLARDDPLAHRRLVAALVESITTGASDVTPDDEALRRFYAEHPQYFRRGARLELTRIFVRVDGGNEAEARRRAEAARARLRAGEPADRVRAALGNEPVSPLPPDLLPAEAIREYLGPTAARVTQDLEPGAVSDPVRVGGGYEVMRVDRKEPGGAAPFDTVRDSVLAEYRRSAGAAALKQHIEELRAAAEVHVNDAVLAAVSAGKDQSVP